MLQLCNIKKKYRTGKLVQRAVDDISVSFRDSEFVAILGPSGSGKTTLLNIIGGLDRYDSGDLVISGVSTKRYRDRDWDSYRNHTIGFVFQSYNLIGHQTVLANVEMALTISGISGRERRDRALRVLEAVGLRDQAHKRPNQMSGGQMQRVAIARALVNDPDIVLADEPTGALDSETSIQVMDLLRQVAKDRLVIMVTHNPDLAQEYATRIIRIKDGRLDGDTDPFDPGTEADLPVHRNLGHASMSFFTALQLSFNNLRTKLARTLLVAFAGSIGIIGISLIMALSTGANRYIEQEEQKTLADYPLQIQKTGYDMMGVMSSYSQEMAGPETETEDQGEGKTDQVLSVPVLETFFSGVKTNDLASFKAYLESGTSGLEGEIREIRYDYGLTPRIYREAGENLYQASPSNLLSSISAGSGDLDSAMTASFRSAGTLFHEMPGRSALDNLKLTAGTMPEKEDELLLVVSSRNRVSDLMLYTIGLLDRRDLEAYAKRLEKGQEASLKNPDRTFDYEDFLGLTFRQVSAADLFAYDREYGVWTDKSDNEKYVKKLVEKGRLLHVTGIACESSETTTSMQGFYYTHALTEAMMEEASQSRAVQEQLKHPEKNLFTGERFDAKRDDSEIDLSKLFTVDEDAFAKLFEADQSKLDLSSLAGSFHMGSLDLGSVDFGKLDLGSQDLEKLLGQGGGGKALLSEREVRALFRAALVQKTPEETQKTMSDLFGRILSGYEAYAAQGGKPQIASLRSDLSAYLHSDKLRTILEEKVGAILARSGETTITDEDLQTLTGTMAAYLPGYLVYAKEHKLTNLLDADQLQAYLATTDARQKLADFVRQKTPKPTVTAEDVAALAQTVQSGYDTWAAENGKTSMQSITDSFAAYLQTEEVSSLVGKTALEFIDTEALSKKAAKILGKHLGSLTQGFEGRLKSVMASVGQAMAGQISEAIRQGLSQMSGQLNDALSDQFDIDPAQFGEVIKANFDADEMQELLTSLLTDSGASYEGNLAKLGYADSASPAGIDLYAQSFEAKDRIIKGLEDYNRQKTEAGEEEKVITYTDLVGTLMKSVTKIIGEISLILIAFVAVSLVVSSIMIGIITYISVLERRKEIGILRALGASKRNVRQVFHAETFITGLLAGGIGVGLTYAAVPFLNILVTRLAQNENFRAGLPLQNAAGLILLSVILTMIAGTIPAQKASKSDPVAALRAE